MKSTTRILGKAAGVATLAMILAACGGNSPSTASTPTTGSEGPIAPTTPVAIEGVATPSSVAVVTATNAN